MALKAEDFLPPYTQYNNGNMYFGGTFTKAAYDKLKSELQVYLDEHEKEITEKLKDPGIYYLNVSSRGVSIDRGSND